jgi:hypothetical protein
MAITQVDITNYIKSLNIVEGDQYSILFNKLLLIDSILFQQCIEKLISGDILITDLLNLQIVNDSIIESFLLDTDAIIQDAAMKREFYKNILNVNYNYLDMRSTVIDDFSKYIHKRFINSSNYFTEVAIDDLGLIPNSFLSFFDVTMKYLNISSTSSLINQKYIAFSSFHNSFPYKIDFLISLVDNAINNPIFIDSYLNTKKFTLNSDYEFLLNELYKYKSPYIIDSIHRELILKMADRYDEDTLKTGWIVISDEIDLTDWTFTDNKTMNEQFIRKQLLRYYYPEIYGVANDKVILSDELIIINDLIAYFDLARDVLIAVRDEIRNKINI